MITGGRRLRRALTRALLTVGGAAGLTAAAWCLSTACASAGTLGDHLQVVDHGSHAVVTQGHSPETASADDGVHEMARAVATASKPTVSSLVDEHQTLATGANLPSAADFDRFAHQVQDDFVQVGRHVATPAPAALVGDSVTLVRHVAQFPLATLPVRLPIPVIGELSGVSTTTDGTPQSVSSTGSNPADATAGAMSEAVADAPAATAPTARHSLPPHRSSDPSGPRNSMPTPAAPAQAPSAPCCFGNGGVGAAGVPNPEQLPFGNTFGAAAYRSVVATSQSVSMLTGKQAGITPD
ncbi:hypothetical protein [Kutzneria sp. CA-103260]|uniref:hypothetical protein n=1 Tax=Kutzneria sp. CA-103260 TaxID=2802641 RepID=UPI001BAB38B6|nr:hypothetical protein [Kutzneria sp. CA-103260]